TPSGGKPLIATRRASASMTPFQSSWAHQSRSAFSSRPAGHQGGDAPARGGASARRTGTNRGRRPRPRGGRAPRRRRARGARKGEADRGYVYQRANGAWAIQLMPGGVRHHLTAPAPTEVRRLRDDLVARWRAGAAAQDPRKARRTLAVFLREW